MLYDRFLNLIIKNTINSFVTRHLRRNLQITLNWCINFIIRLEKSLLKFCLPQRNTKINSDLGSLTIISYCLCLVYSNSFQARVPQSGLTDTRTINSACFYLFFFSANFLFYLVGFVTVSLLLRLAINWPTLIKAASDTEQELRGIRESKNIPTICTVLSYTVMTLALGK